MIRKSICFAVIAIVGFALTDTEEVEAQVYFGPQVLAWDFEEIGVGGRVDFALGGAFGIEEGLGAGLFGTVNGNYLFVGDSDFRDDFSVLMFNANVAVPFGLQGSVVPYAGVGVNRIRISDGIGSGGNSGLNILGGIFFDLGSIPSYLELQHSTTGSGYLSLSFGFLFGG